VCAAYGSRPLFGYDSFVWAAAGVSLVSFPLAGLQSISPLTRPAQDQVVAFATTVVYNNNNNTRTVVAVGPFPYLLQLYIAPTLQSARTLFTPYLSPHPSRPYNAYIIAGTYIYICIHINVDEWVSDFLLTNRTSRHTYIYIYRYSIIYTRCAFRSVKKRARENTHWGRDFYDLYSAEQKAIEHDFRAPRWGVRRRCSGRMMCV